MAAPGPWPATRAAPTTRARARRRALSSAVLHARGDLVSPLQASTTSTVVVRVVEHDLQRLPSLEGYAAASVVYVYLYPKAVAKVMAVLQRAVDDGKRVVVYCTSGCSATPGNLIATHSEAETLLQWQRQHTFAAMAAQSNRAAAANPFFWSSLLHVGEDFLKLCTKS